MSETRMLGKKHKPFCGDHCCPYRQGTGRRNKRILKRQNKAKEQRVWMREALELIN